jgi:hypothetical protein
LLVALDPELRADALLLGDDKLVLVGLRHFDGALSETGAPAMTQKIAQDELRRPLTERPRFREGLRPRRRCARRP